MLIIYTTVTYLFNQPVAMSLRSKLHSSINLKQFCQLLCIGLKTDPLISGKIINCKVSKQSGSNTKNIWISGG
jgi:hypothetical protein